MDKKWIAIALAILSVVIILSLFGGETAPRGAGIHVFREVVSIQTEISGNLHTVSVGLYDDISPFWKPGRILEVAPPLIPDLVGKPVAIITHDEGQILYYAGSVKMISVVALLGSQELDRINQYLTESK